MKKRVTKFSRETGLCKGRHINKIETQSKSKQNVPTFSDINLFKS